MFAAGPLDGAPPWSKLLIYGGFGVIVCTHVALFLVAEPAAERRVYWAGWITGSALIGVAELHHGVRSSIGTFLGMGLLGIALALRYGTDLLIRREPRPSPPPPEFTLMPNIRDGSGPPMWWALTTGSATTAALAIALNWNWRSWVFGAMVVIAAGFMGLDDGRRRFPFARRQHVQAALTALFSVPVLGLPIAAYALGYRAGTTQAVSRSRHDAEDRFYHPEPTPTDEVVDYPPLPPDWRPGEPPGR